MRCIALIGHNAGTLRWWSWKGKGPGHNRSHKCISPQAIMHQCPNQVMQKCIRECYSEGYPWYLLRSRGKNHTIVFLIWWSGPHLNSWVFFRYLLVQFCFDDTAFLVDVQIGYLNLNHFTRFPVDRSAISTPIHYHFPVDRSDVPLAIFWISCRS
jgi:hypothetical protein